jgi:ethanolamine permease
MGKVHSNFKTPANALLINMGIGIIALFSGKTGEIITISVFGALTLYIISMISLFKLRKNEPELERPFKVPMYPFFPAAALLIALVALAAVTFYNQKLALIFLGLIGASYLYFVFRNRQKNSL